MALTQKIKLKELENFIGYRLRRAQLSVFSDFIESCAEVGLRPAQFSVLYLIDQNHGIKQSDIAKALGFQRTNFVVMLDELESRGLARREKSETDKRSHEIYLTEQGKQRLEDAMEAVQAHEERMIAKIGADNKAELLKFLKKFE